MELFGNHKIAKKNPQNPQNPSRDTFECEICDYNTSHKGDWNKHTITAKHIKNMGIVKSENFSSNFAVPKVFPKVTKVPKKEKFTCLKCGYNTLHKGSWKKHISTEKHKTALSKVPKKVPKKEKFTCLKCGYNTSHKGTWEKHISTEKHKTAPRQRAGGQAWPLGHPVFKCKYCQKKFITKSGRWKHIKKCDEKIRINSLYEKIEKMQKQIEELKDKKYKECLQENENLKNKLEHKTITQNFNTQQNININFFLNEKCKDAMPIMDFIKELQFTLTDINPERPASTIESLSKVIVEKLGDMAETERPVHCSDAKRLKFYVKDASGWTQDDDNKKIDKAIGWANMRHQGAWYDRVKEEGLAQTEKDTTYHTMNVAMAKFSDDPNKAKKKIKRAIAGATNLKNAKKTLK